MENMEQIIGYGSPTLSHRDDEMDQSSSTSKSEDKSSSIDDRDINDDRFTEKKSEMKNGIYSNHSEYKKQNFQAQEKTSDNTDRKTAVASATTNQSPAPLVESGKYIPMRLTEEERKLLIVLENALEVCEYTDVVDVTFSYTRKSKQARILENLVDMLSISCGLLLSNNLTKGEKIIAGKTLTDNIGLFRDIFEIGRRYKIMNPSKMRNTYGKLMYILMDTESYHIKQELNIDFVKPIMTVASFLEDKGILHMLEDPLLQIATRSIDNEMNDKSAHELEIESQRKSDAVKELISEYTQHNGRNTPTESDIRRVIDSIADNNAYYSFNVRPVDRMLEILTEFFDAKGPTAPEYSLELSLRPKKYFSSFSLYGGGSGYSSKYYGSGSCLNHDHKTQYTFVLQSLTLWKEIMTHLPKLWYLADGDMTREMYRLADTGQGYQRLQSCPRVSKAMSNILNRVQSRCGPWVGLSVVHLGDRDVPNALVFIDKYTQVPRILAPIAQCIERLPQLVEDAAFHRYVSEEWGSISSLRMQILSDFFKHGFDGSGDDGGSCIDGRLTSAWNWCSKLHKKPYYYVFMFTGFQGFDGDFK